LLLKVRVLASVALTYWLSLTRGALGVGLAPSDYRTTRCTRSMHAGNPSHISTPRTRASPVT